MMEGNLSFFALGGQSASPRSGGSSDSPQERVDDHGNPLRQRQQHRKSRTGCAHCKRRKVKVSGSQFKARFVRGGEAADRTSRDSVMNQCRLVGTV